MKRILTVVVCCLCLYHCSTTKESQEPQEKVFKPGTYFKAIEHARNSKPVNFALIDSLYTSDLMSFVKSADPASDAVFKEAVAKGAEGDMPHVQSQTISKTIQKVFFNEITSLLQALKNETDEKAFKEKLAILREYYAVISSTVVRRGEWIGKGRELDDVCRMQLQETEKSFGNENIAKHLSSFENTLRDTYILSVLYELVGIGENRGKNAEKCEEKVVEGRIFLEIVEKYAIDTTVIGTLKNAFTADYRELDVEKTIALVGQVFSFDIPEVAR